MYMDHPRGIEQPTDPLAGPQDGKTVPGMTSPWYMISSHSELFRRLKYLGLVPRRDFRVEPALLG